MTTSRFAAVTLAGLLCWALLVPGAARAATTSVYVANANTIGGGGVSQYDAGPGGVLSPKTPSSVGGGDNPIAVAVSPDGKSVYVANSQTSGGGGVSQYDVGPGGLLSPKTPSSAGGGSLPVAVAVSPDGQSVYVVNRGTNGAGGVSQYDIGLGGVLSVKSPSSVAAGNSPNAVAVSPDGRSVYVTNVATNGAGGVSEYDVGPGGVLSPKATPTVAAGSGPAAVAVSPDGTSVYVANVGAIGAGGVSEYNVGPGGVLSPKTPSSVAAGPNPIGIAVSPDGHSVYVANIATSGAVANGVSEYDVGPGGVLSPKATPTVAAGPNPAGIAVSPGGKSVFVTNSGTNGPGGVSQYDVEAGGVLSPKATPTVAAGNGPDGIAVVPDQGPSASFTAVAAPTGAGTRFDGSGSSDPDGTVARYDWSFGDGTTLANGGGTPTHTYAQAGTYTARLTVTDDGGCSTMSVFTGQTTYCNGGAAATTTRSVTVSSATLSNATLSRLSVRPHKFSLAGRKVGGLCVKPTAKTKRQPTCRRPVKLTIGYALNRSATVTFTLKRNAVGRNVKGHCVTQTSQNKQDKRCSRPVPVHGSITETGAAGANSFTFDGRLGGRDLGPGSYQLTATPSNGSPQTATFKLVR